MPISVVKKTTWLSIRELLIDNAALRGYFGFGGVTPPTTTKLKLYVRKTSGSEIYCHELDFDDLVVVKWDATSTTNA